MAGITAAQLRGLFAQEAEGRLIDLGNLLNQLEQTGGDEKIIRSIYREFHTLKGSAAVAGIGEVNRIAHDLEGLADTLRVGGQPVTSEVIETLRIGAAQLSTAIRTAQHAPPVASPVAATPGSPHAEPHGRPPAGRPSIPLEHWAELDRVVGETAAAHQRLARVFQERFQVEPATCAEFDELARLLNDLQDRARRTQRVPVSTMADRLHRVVSDLARAQGKHVRWQADGTDTELDRDVMDQLFDSLLHLVRNAVDHGIELPEQRDRAGKRAEGTIRFRAVRLNTDVVISVTDDGQGIDGPGRGVGLDRVRASVEAAHGRVDVQSYPGAGTEFRIIVPVPHDLPPVSPATYSVAPTAPEAKSARQHQSILVVDDAPTLREVQRAILVRAGFDVRVATDGTDALARLAEAPSDLVLTDLQMPNMGGYALTEAIRADPTLTHIPVLILSSSSAAEDRQRGLDAGANGYLEKGGFDEASLLSAVSQLLGVNA